MTRSDGRKSRSLREGDEICFLYTTCADRSEAERLAKAMIEKGLAACANIFPPHLSVYRWQGEIQREEEVAMFLKTTRAAADALIKALVRMHSYDCPCAVILNVEGGHPPFLSWIAAETSRASN